MIVVIFEVTGQPPQMDGFGDDVKIFHKNGFVRIDAPAGNKMLACYNPARIVAIRRIDAPAAKPDENLNAPASGENMNEALDPKTAAKVVANPQDQDLNKNADEALHPGNGSKGQ